MLIRIAFLAILAVPPIWAQKPLGALTFGGSGNDSIRGIATDASGNIYVTGTTASFDLPLLHASQSSNSGTQVVYSTDSGATWQPLVNPFPTVPPFFPIPIAADPTNDNTLFVASGNSVCKSMDGGRHFQCVALPFPAGLITSLAIDPANTATLYASVFANGGLFKSRDGGQTWIGAAAGLLNESILSVTIDPFHPNVLYAWDGAGGYVSRDAANSWSRTTLPWPAGTSFLGVGGRFVFDPVQPGILYGPGFAANQTAVQKSVDGGQTWTPLQPSFDTCCFTPDPKVSGTLYALAASKFWKSTDGGATWNAFDFPATLLGSIVVDPFNPQVILSSGFRSGDGGQTWGFPNVSRAVRAVFEPGGVVYATAPSTSDAFLAKFLPDGKTLVFSTYFGGMGDETANGIALDSAGNIWIAGSTSSVDLPVPQGAFQNALKGLPTNAFAAKFSNDGKLLAATYLGGAGQAEALGIAINPQDNPWLIGSSGSGGFLNEIDSAAETLLYATGVDGYFDQGGKGIAIDPVGNVTVAGYTLDAKFPVTAGAFHSGAPGNTAKTFVMKVDPAGQVIYSTYIGGSQPPPMFGPGGERDTGVAVAVDSAGNAYVAGNTSALDFPTTPGAYQTTFADGCPFPAFSYGSIFFGVSYVYLVDDVFATKLSPDGKTALYSTLLGGSCYDRVTGIAVGASGQAYVTGETDSTDFPLISAVEAAPPLQQFKSFVSALSPDGSALTFSTYLNAGSAPSVAAGLGGSILVGGSAGLGAQTPPPNPGFPTPLPVVATDGYIAIVNSPASAPAVNLTGILNAFSLLPGAVSPGEIVALTVPGFAPASPADIGLNALAPLTTNLAEAQVFFDGRPAYLISAFPGKIVCIAPVEIAGQTDTSVQVSINGAPSNVLTANVAETALGLLSADGSGTGLANARNADGTLNGPDNPALRGSTITLFLTGAGLTNPPEPDGVVVSGSGIRPVAPISIFSTTPDPVHALPGFVPGIFALDLAIPLSRSPGQLGVSLAYRSFVSRTLSIYIQ